MCIIKKKKIETTATLMLKYQNFNTLLKKKNKTKLQANTKSWCTKQIILQVKLVLFKAFVQWHLKLFYNDEHELKLEVFSPCTWVQQSLRYWFLQCPGQSPPSPTLQLPYRLLLCLLAVDDHFSCSAKEISSRISRKLIRQDNIPQPISCQDQKLIFLRAINHSNIRDRDQVKFQAIITCQDIRLGHFSFSHETSI